MRTDAYGRYRYAVASGAQTVQARFVTNGEEAQPEQYDLRLSDAYEHLTEKPELELICRVYNINHGRNRELLDRCPVLKGYMTFVDYVREYHREKDYDNLTDAIEKAIDRCIREDILADFFGERRSEVLKVMELDYTFDRQLMLEREDAREEGREEGRAKGLEEGRKAGREEGCKEGWTDGRVKLIADFFANGGTEDDAIKMLRATPEEIQKAKKVQ